MKKIIAYVKNLDIKDTMKIISHFFRNDFFQPILSSLMLFKHKPRMIIFLFVSFLCFISMLPFDFTTNIFVFVFVIAVLLSPVLESMLRCLYDVRYIATSKEKQRLNILFSEVYNKVKKDNKYVSNDIQLFLSDTLKIEAFTLSKNTIVLSTGMLQTFSDTELQAILAHEFYHVLKGDAQVKMLVWFGTSIYTTVAVIVYHLIEWIQLSLGDGFIGSILKLVNLALYGFLTITVNLLCFIVGGNDRRIEYKADLYALRLGYARDMISGLYITQSMEIADKKLFSKRLMENHPRTAYRIEKLEKLL